jgi:hypothetical protein
MMPKPKRKLSRIDGLLMLNLFSHIVKISSMGKDLEKSHKTKIVMAQICLIADNGELVYETWASPESKKTFGKLVEYLGREQSEILPDLMEHISKVAPFGFVRRLEPKE